MKIYKTFFSASLCFASLLSFGQAQKLTMPNGQATFFSGMNVAWNNYGNDVGDALVDRNHFDKMLNEVKAEGGNCVRWWLFTNASSAPKFNNGLVSGLGANSINNIKTVLDLAKDKDMAVVLCLFSFDLLQTQQQGVNGYNNKQMLTTDAGIKACIDRCIVPLVTAIGEHPAIQCWEIFNEPEGMLTDGGWTNERLSMFDIQRFTNRAAGAIRRAVPNVLISNGSKSFFYLSPTIGKNYYTNIELVTAGGDKDGYLDFYMVHYYDNEGGNGQQHSPFHHNASYWQMDKPILVAEFGAKGYNKNFNMSPTECYKQIYERGYVGALSWTYTGHDGFGSLNEAKAGIGYLKTNFPNDLIFSAQPSISLGTNRALNKPVTVSSTEANSIHIAKNINDGNNGTRWSSLYADNQSVIIDLQTRYSISDIVINWEAAYAQTYSIQVSNDLTTWTSLLPTTTGNGGKDILQKLNGAGRYIRLNLIKRATTFGFSVYEIEVYGSAVVTSLEDETISTSNVFPNPFQDKITLNLLPNSEVELSDMNGHLIYKGSDNQIETSALPHGMYVLKMTQNGNTRIIKMSKN